MQETYIPEDTSIFKDRRLTALPDGRLALVPASTRAGDHIVCLAGSKVPYVVRPHDDGMQISNAEIHDTFPKRGSFKSSLRGCIACQNDLVRFQANAFSKISDNPRKSAMEDPPCAVIATNMVTGLHVLIVRTTS